jgi:hypothetical protein
MRERPCLFLEKPTNGPFFHESSREKLSNSSIVVTLQAGAVSPGDFLESPAKRHGARSRCQLREADELQDAEVKQRQGGMKYCPRTAHLDSRKKMHP